MGVWKSGSHEEWEFNRLKAQVRIYAQVREQQNLNSSGSATDSMLKWKGNKVKAYYQMKV